jgi:hypothetical protein
VVVGGEDGKRGVVYGCFKKNLFHDWATITEGMRW